MRFTSLPAIAGLVASLCAVQSALAQFPGSAVIVQARYPNLATNISTDGPVVVSGAVEFPSLLSGAWSSDIGYGQIILTQNAAGNALGNASFNGFVYSFAGAPTITGAFLDGSSTLVPTGLAFTPTEVQINYAGYGLATAGQQTVVNVWFVPEPGSLTLLGLGALPMLARRRFKR